MSARPAAVLTIATVLLAGWTFRAAHGKAGDSAVLVAAAAPARAQENQAARLNERAHQSRDIVYFLQAPETHTFSLFHDYTEAREGTDKYLNIVRQGSTVSKPAAWNRDTGESLRTETLEGEAITRAGLDIGEPVGPESQVVVVRFPPVKKGQSTRIRIEETYTDSQRYRLDGDELVFDRSLGRALNAIVLPAGWYLTASSMPCVVSELADGRIRLDLDNPRPDGLNVLLKARRRPR